MSGGSRVWVEARKQERRLKGMMVDYKKRAERRREYYDKIKTDPAQFMQVHGRAMKIHLDPSIAAQAEAPSTMMPWQGQQDTIIDRFDVRAHLDVIPEPKSTTASDAVEEESHINYERFRILVQNDFAQVKEQKFLHQIYLEERFGGSSVKKAEQEAEKKKLAEKKAAIGYNYDDSSSQPADPTADLGGGVDDPSAATGEGGESEDEEEIDLDIAFDVDQIPAEQAREMNQLSTTYGMAGTEFIDQLVRDKVELEALREAKAVEEERAASRRNRRDRRRAREQARARDLNTLRTGDTTEAVGLYSGELPAYAAPESRLAAKAGELLREKSSSRSPSPEERGKVCFITSFGGDSGDEPAPLAEPERQKSKSYHRGKESSSSPSVRSSEPRSSKKSLHSREPPSKKSRPLQRSPSSSSDDSVSSRERRRRRARRAEEKMSCMHRRSRKNTGSTSSSSSPSRSRSRGKRCSTSPAPQQEQPVKLPTPPRKSYYRHDLKSDESADEGSSPDEESNTVTFDRPNDVLQVMQMPEAIQGQLLQGQQLSLSQEQSSALADSFANGNHSFCGPLTLRNDSLTSHGENAKASGTSLSNDTSCPSGSAGTKSSTKLTPQERLRRKMQAMLRKTHQTDQLARLEKEEKAREERLQRQEQLKEHLAKYGKSEGGQWNESDYSEEAAESFSPRRRTLSRERESEKPKEYSRYSKTDENDRDWTYRRARDAPRSRRPQRSISRGRSRSRSGSRTHHFRSWRSRSHDRGSRRFEYEDSYYDYGGSSSYRSNPVSSSWQRDREWSYDHRGGTSDRAYYGRGSQYREEMRYSGGAPYSRGSRYYGYDRGDWDRRSYRGGQRSWRDYDDRRHDSRRGAYYSDRY